MARGRARPGRQELVWLLPGCLNLLLQGIQHVAVRGPAGGVADASANLTWPFSALLAGLDRDVHKMSWTHLGTYDYNVIEFAVLSAFLVAGFLVLRATTAPVHERAAFVGFVLVEVVCASGQFWYSVFGEGRTYVDAYLLAVILLLATPAEAAGEVHASLADCLFARNRAVAGRHLAGLAFALAVALVLVARRRVLFE
jgi:hypothetical protein